MAPEVLWFHGVTKGHSLLLALVLYSRYSGRSICPFPAGYFFELMQPRIQLAVLWYVDACSVYIYFRERFMHSYIHGFSPEQLQCFLVSKIIEKSTALSTQHMNQNQSFLFTALPSCYCLPSRKARRNTSRSI